MFSIILCLLFLFSHVVAHAGSSTESPNFIAHFGATPSPFKIDVKPEFIAETKLKASLTRSTIDLDVPAWFDGPPTQNVSAVRDYWVHQYDWESVQEGLNKQCVIFFS
jgi:hypothetical protein